METIIFMIRLWWAGGRGYASARVTFENQTSVRAAEAERIGQRVLDIHGARVIRHIVEIALRIGEFVIDGGRRDLIANGQNREAGLESTGPAEQVPRHGLGGTHCELVGVIAEASFNGQRLDLIANFGGGAVRVDVLDLLAADAGVLERMTHDAE